MARTVETILRQQLGNLLAEIAVLTAENERLSEELAKQPPVKEQSDGKTE